MKTPLRLLAVAAVALLPAVSADASVITALQGSRGTFNVSSTDLGQAPGTTVTLNSGTADFGSSLPNLNDGLTYNGDPPGFNTHSFTTANGVVTFQFDVASQPGGYIINSIQSLSGYVSRTQQVFTASYELVGQSSFTNFATVNGSVPNNAERNGEVQVTITDSVLTGVSALRFSYGPGAAGSVVYLELDINGQAVPEPSTLALGAVIALIGGGLAWRRRAGHRSNPARGPEEPHNSHLPAR